MILSELETGRRITHEVRDVSFDLTADVLVIGAGTAGVFAAVGAAREGASVILAENSDVIGGMHVGGFVTGYYYGNEGGSYLETDRRAGARTCFLGGNRQPECKQATFTEYLAEAGVRILTRHTPIGVYSEGCRTVGVRLFSDGVFCSIGAHTVIDATSDGYLLRMCDIKARYGRAIDGKTAPFTTRVSYLKDGRLCFTNLDSGYVDQYDDSDLSYRAILAHAHADRILREGELLSIAYHTGIREGLCFEGEATLTYSDIILDSKPDDPLFYAYSDLDKHGHDLALDEELYQNWWVVSNLSTVTAQIPVPFGSVVPKGLKGIVSAGRCFSCDSYAQSAVRMVRDMMRMGECVGVAAAMAGDSGDLLTVDRARYLKRVKELGCFGDEAKNRFGFCAPNGKLPYTPVVFDPEEALPLLKTDRPGVAVWSCFRDGSTTLADRLAEMLETAYDELHRYNLGIALGVMGDRRALPILREIVLHRDCFYFKDCRRTNQFRSAIALCLLGRIGEACDLPLLEEIVFDPREIERPLYHTLKPDYLYHTVGDRNFVFFALFTHAAAALVKLTGRLGLDSASLHARLSALAESGRAVRDITAEAPDAPSHIEAADFLSHMVRLSRP